ncbi:response regulator transcription factor [Roseiflexus sp.]|uniref:response regulator transcription factor n=1 Tax=Roseiflexus sp. TaxID=2562120 RepID=UPI0021DBF353|nr:response regulator [Roseiflexus sp.]GIW02312.1 MAG: response regulator [Roseiflexus sp.]
MMPHILIVEDSRTQALRFQLELQRCGARVDVARDGVQGLEYARALRPSAIVLDIDLPGMDGYTLCRRLKQAPDISNVPIIMLTHREDARSAQTGLESGADDYIPKDEFAEQNLIESLRALGVLQRM